MCAKHDLSRRSFLFGSAGAIAAGAAAATVGCSSNSKCTGTIGDIESKIKLDRFEHNFSVVDSHTEGEFCRIVVDGFPEPVGSTVMEKKKFMESKHDNLRTSLM